MKADMSAGINWNSIEKEAADILVRYLQINTTNPPGNETAGAVFLKSLLEREGIACEIFESIRTEDDVKRILAEPLILHTGRWW